MNYNCENLKADNLEENKRMLYELNINLQDILIDIIKSYSQIDKLNYDSSALDDSEIVQHKKLLIAIVKKLDLIKKYSNELEKLINEYDTFDTIILKLNDEVANSIDDFLIENLPAEDVVVEDDIYTALKWIKNKNYDNGTSKKFIGASGR